MAHLYYDEQLSTSEVRVGARIEITGDEARHAVRVSRLRVGERTLVGNGRGVLAHGAVEEAERERFTLRVDEVTTVPPSRPRMILVQALAKGDRGERAIEQATEFGVDAIIPWEATRSVSRWGREKSARGVQKWARIVREAAKQSLRHWVPEVEDPVSLAELTRPHPARRMIVLQPGAKQSLTAWARQIDWEQREAAAAFTELAIVVGPEGGIDDAELGALRDAGAEVLSLGDMVLRTSSAGPAALAVLNAAIGRW